MLLHSDLKFKRWDPHLSFYGNKSTSVLRDYDDTLGGGKMLSMKPYFINPNSLVMAYNNPYRAMYAVPPSYGTDNTVYMDDQAMKDHISAAVKHYILNERHNIKEEIIDDIQGRERTGDEIFTRASRLRASNLDMSRVFTDIENDISRSNHTASKVEEISVKSKPKKSKSLSKSKNSTKENQTKKNK